MRTWLIVCFILVFCLLRSSIFGFIGRVSGLFLGSCL